MKKQFAPVLLTPLLLAFPTMQQEKAATLPTIDKPAPTFRLNHHEGELASIGGAQKTWSILAFFPKAMTPG